MALVGITGGIGAGKTTVLQVFQCLGAVALDADDIVHQLYVPGAEGWRRLKAHWGSTVLSADGGIDRQAVASLVFSKPAEREWLNQATHPLVQAEILKAAAAAKSRVICAVPLLFEAGWEPLFQHTIAVWCDAPTQQQRLLSRGWTSDAISARLATQMSMDDKLLKADFVLINTGTPAFLEAQCRKLWMIMERISNERTITDV